MAAWRTTASPVHVRSVDPACEVTHGSWQVKQPRRASGSTRESSAQHDIEMELHTQFNALHEWPQRRRGLQLPGQALRDALPASTAGSPSMSADQLLQSARTVNMTSHARPIVLHLRPAPEHPCSRRKTADHMPGAPLCPGAGIAGNSSCRNCAGWAYRSAWRNSALWMGHLGPPRPAGLM